MLKRYFTRAAAVFLGVLVLGTIAALFRNVFFVWSPDDVRARFGEWLLLGLVCSAGVPVVWYATRSGQKETTP